MSVAPESGRNRIMIYGPKGDGTTQWPSGKALTGSTRRHCGPPALAMPITLMTAPSVITPRSANKLNKAKQLSGTASASNKSRFMAKCGCLWLRRLTEF